MKGYLERKKEDRIESYSLIDIGNEFYLLRFCLFYFGIFLEG